jgi:hypothetical protein
LWPESLEEQPPTSIAGVLRLRAEALRKDDDFVEGPKHGQVCKRREKIEKVTGSQDDVFVRALTKNIPTDLALTGHVGPVGFDSRIGGGSDHVVILDAEYGLAC